jgi:cell division topological specificity factor
VSIFSFFNKEEKSKDVAKDRLKLVLIHDRAMLSSGMLEQMRDDIIAVISKYVEIDKESLNIEIAENPDNTRRTTLVANIPLKQKKS